MSRPVFILASDLRPEASAWACVLAQADALQVFAARALGVPSRVGVACLPARATEDAGDSRLGRAIDRQVADGASVVFVLPAAFELNVWQRTLLGEELSEARRRHSAASIHHDTIDPTHPLLVDCFSDSILRALHESGISPRQAGLLLVADGQSDAATRADSYRLMRLLWEQTSLSRGEVGFVRHAQPFLSTVLQRCLHAWGELGHDLIERAAVSQHGAAALPGRAAALDPVASMSVGRRIV